MKFKLILALLLISSLGANVFFARKTMYYYTLLNALRLDPLELKSHPEHEEISSKTRVVMVGDSRVQAWPSIRSSSFETFNRGIHGQTTIQIRDRFEAHVQSLQPNIVVLQLGMNDLKTIGLFPQQKEEILEDCKRNIDIIIEKARKMNAQVILTTIIPAGPIPLIRRPVWSHDIEVSVRDANQHIRNLDKEGVYIFDVAVLVDDTHYLDALHLEQEAYKKLNLHLEELILRMIQFKN